MESMYVTIIKKTSVWLLLCITFYLTLIAFTPLTEWQWDGLVPASATRDSQADVAVVLGYTLTKNGSVDTVLADRLRKGMELLRAGRVKKIMVSGGLQNRTIQADVMSRWLYERGVAKEDVIWEGNSNNTWQNAEMSLEIVRQKEEWKSVLVVTSSFHSIRSQAVFEWTLHNMKKKYPNWHVDINAAEPLEGEYRPRWHGQWDYVREVGALLWYAIKKRLNPWPILAFLLTQIFGPYLIGMAIMYVPVFLYFATTTNKRRKKKGNTKKKKIN